MVCACEVNARSQSIIETVVIAVLIPATAVFDFALIAAFARSATAERRTSCSYVDYRPWSVQYGDCESDLRVALLRLRGLRSFAWATNSTSAREH